MFYNIFCSAFWWGRDHAIFSHTSDTLPCLCCCFSQQDCVYLIAAKTGADDNSGTDSKIDCILQDRLGGHVDASDLVQFGLMGEGHAYFQPGNYDLFGVPGTCLDAPVCNLTLISDGSGDADWFIDYVRVRVLTAPILNTLFDVEGWLGPNFPPHMLTRTFNKCDDPPPQKVVI